jgi:hypothetical protein
MRDHTMTAALRSRPRTGADDSSYAQMLLHEALSRSRQHRAE